MNTNNEDLLSVIKSYKESSKNIADLYLERFPRKLCCEVTVGPSELILASFLLEVTDEEIAIIHECMKSVRFDAMRRRVGNTFDEALAQKGYTNLLDRLHKPFATDEKKEFIEAMSKYFSRELTPYIDSVNLHDLKKVCHLRIF